DAVAGANDRHGLGRRDDAHHRRPSAYAIDPRGVPDKAVFMVAPLSHRSSGMSGPIQRAGWMRRTGHSDLMRPRPTSSTVGMTSSWPGACRIRPIAPGDREALARFYGDLSFDSRESRFHGASPGIGDGMARFFCGPDHEHREG